MPTPVDGNAVAPSPRRQSTCRHHRVLCRLSPWRRDLSRGPDSPSKSLPLKTIFGGVALPENKLSFVVMFGFQHSENRVQLAIIQTPKERDLVKDGQHFLDIQQRQPVFIHGILG